MIKMDGIRPKKLIFITFYGAGKEPNWKKKLLETQKIMWKGVVEYNVKKTSR